jgi:hypothetical protein
VLNRTLFASFKNLREKLMAERCKAVEGLSNLINLFVV